ncbi:MAG TPA: KEOPS complex subunit Pcc1 [Candidatus Acidoferrum sp.]|nr:KEOPS complex subunit Pcc1 [Candidatus Acidoferrum sp.]
MEAEIVLEYDEARMAEAVANAVSPDNFKTPVDLTVKTMLKEKKVLTRIVCKEKLPTFIATIDDLLSCVSTAEKALLVALKFE